MQTDQRPRNRPPGAMYRWANQTGDQAELWIYDEIGWSWDGEGVTAKQFTEDLREVRASEILLHLNSPGGDVFEGVAIHNALKEHRARVTVKVEGLAASAASYIAMAGDRIVMSTGAMLMIHDGWGITMGNAADHRKTAELLDRLSDNIAGFYARRAGGTVADWRAKMQSETWFTDQEAVKAGLADEVMGDETAVKNTFDLSAFRQTPSHLLSDRETIVDTITASADNHAAPLVTATSQEPTAATDQEPKLSAAWVRLHADLVELGAV